MWQVLSWRERGVLAPCPRSRSWDIAKITVILLLTAVQGGGCCPSYCPRNRLLQKVDGAEAFGPLTGLVRAEDGQRLLGIGYRHSIVDIRLLEGRVDKVHFQPTPPDVWLRYSRICYLGDHGLFAAAGEIPDGTSHVVDLFSSESLDRRSRHTVHQYSCDTLVFDESEDILITRSWQCMKIWRLPDMALAAEINVRQFYEESDVVAFEGKYLGVYTDIDTKVSGVYSATATSGDLQLECTLSDRIRRADISPSGRLVAAVLRTEAPGEPDAYELRIYQVDGDGPTYYTLSAFDLQGLACLAFSKSERLLIGTYYDGRFGVWDLSTRQRVAVLSGLCRILTYPGSYLVDESTLLVGDDRNITLWDISSQK